MENYLSDDELILMRKLGEIASKFLRELKKFIHPNITTQEIEDYFLLFLKDYPDVKPAFKGYQGFPASLCVSVNEEVIHGIPSKKRVIKEGDLVSVDLGMERDGLFIDTTMTYPVGKTSKLGRRLIKIGKLALREGIKKVKLGLRIGDISYAIQNFVEKRGFSVVREFVGHGIGRKLHLPPAVPNFGEKGQGEVLKRGMVLAIEPMITAGSFEVEVLNDGWTVRTKDNSLSCHFEHTVAVTKRGPWVLTE